MKQRSWKAIATELNIENGKTAETARRLHPMVEELVLATGIIFLR